MATTSGTLEGKICLVTGATSGIGAVTARTLARLGATVVVVGRDVARCEHQVGRIRREVPGAAAEALVADLSSQAQVRRLAERFAARHGCLDVLVNNAGSYFMRRRASADGLEMTLALNHLGHFLLTLLLVEQLARSPSARVVNVSSRAHVRGIINFDDLQGERRYERLAAYAQSKLANVLFTYELARRLAGTRVTSNALHPGDVATNLGIDNGWVRVKARNLLKRTLISPEEGAATSIHLASSPDVEGVTGRYFVDCTETRSSEASYDRATASRLWRVSEELTGIRWDARVERVALPAAAPRPC
jgi:NAD(P)-dependent dehydrogenase (short-subunit alcohol dehydrogenase family)